MRDASLETSCLSFTVYIWATLVSPIKDAACTYMIKNLKYLFTYYDWGRPFLHSNLSSQSTRIFFACCMDSWFPEIWFVNYLEVNQYSKSISFHIYLVMFHAKVGHGGGDQITLVAATRYLLKTAMETLKLSLHDGALAVPSPGNVGPALEDKLGKKIRKKNISLTIVRHKCKLIFGALYSIFCGRRHHAGCTQKVNKLAFKCYDLKPISLRCALSYHFWGWRHHAGCTQKLAKSCIMLKRAWIKG